MARTTGKLAWLLCGGTLAAVACGKSLRYEPDLAQLMAAIRSENAAATAARDSAARARAGIVKVSSAVGGATLSVDLAQAELAPVLMRALAQSKMPYVVEDHGPAGRTSARFDDKPLLDGLNLLLGREGYRADVQSGVIHVRPSAIAMPDSSYHPDEVIQREVRLDHLDEKSTVGILQQFFGAGAVRAQYDPSRGRVLLLGPRKDVYEAIAMLHRADRAVRHILIEALVVQFDESVLSDLGIDWSKGQTGKFSDISFHPSGAVSPTLTFTNSGNISPASFVAIVQASAGADKARIVARPFITARSGEPASVDIGNTRYYMQPVISNGVLTQNLQSVSTGVKLMITPTAMNDERVRVDMNIEESQFMPTVDDNTSAATATNKVSSSMQVPTGQTIIIGGLALDRQTQSNAGVPFFGRLPLLNLFFAKSKESRANTEVVIFLTPRIWTPDVDLPFTRPDLFQIDTTLTGAPRKP
jgi:type II secretory pathway component GspD/PulD (secretin)